MLALVSKIMGWDDDQYSKEMQWLQLMSQVKYDGYADYGAGVRFIETLATWLKQFTPEDRNTAYRFVKERLVYISPPELQQLIEAFIPETVTPKIRMQLANELKIPSYEVWRAPEGYRKFRRKLRKTLFIGMSDGSRIDILRRANAGKISTEQIVSSMSIDEEKWESLGEALEGDDYGGKNSQFDHVYLIDDFTASGTTFVRQKSGEWKGKLTKFNRNVRTARSNLKDKFPLAPGFKLHIHHYLSSEQARSTLVELVGKAIKESNFKADFTDPEITEGLLLPKNLKLEPSRESDKSFLELCDRYYDHALYLRLKKHCDEAGQSDMKLGYANCALPIVLDHNTPNNSIPLLWAETVGKDGEAHPMEPLFHRRDRHG